MNKENNLLYKSGDIFLTGRIKNFLDTILLGDYESVWYISNWTLMHMISGIIIAFLFEQYKNKYVIGLVIHTIWELWQIYIGMSNAHNRLSGKNGLIDTIIDTLFFFLGMIMYDYIKIN
jgi:hypothetical protein